MSDETGLTALDLRAARERVIDRLSDAFAHDELDVDEFERRVTLAHTVASGAELERLVQGLPAASPAESAAPAAAAIQLVPSDEAPQRYNTVAILGNTERRGRWQVARQMAVKCVMGSMVLDFREARFPSGAVELQVKCVLGDVTLIVPPHLSVETNGSAILGNFEHLDRTPSQLPEGAPVLRVSGSSVLGNVSVQTRLPGERSRTGGARRRRGTWPPGMPGGSCGCWGPMRFLGPGRKGGRE